MKMWTVYIRDQTACSLQSDLNLHFPQKLLPSPIAQLVALLTREQEVAGSILGSANILSED